MRLKKQKGFALITLIIAMVMMTALGAGIYSITTSSTFSELLATRDYNAYQLAKAGMRYAVANSTAAPDGTYCMSGNQCFTITSTSTVAAGVISIQFRSTGNVNAGSFLAANRQLDYTISYSLQSIAGVSFADDMDGFTSPIISNPGASATNQAIYVDEANKTVYGGGNVTDSSGTLVFNGDKSAANCVAGKCDFGLGLNAYFEFTFINEDYTVNYTKCADEGGTCSFSGTNTVRYGQRYYDWWYGWREAWTYRDNVTGSIACNNATFGDPLVGVGKECQIIDRNNLASQANADGFTFFIMSAIKNDSDRRGGQAAGGTSIGELEGYGGPGNTNAGCTVNCAAVKDGLGLKPPKMALELDTWPNPGTENICGANSRNDPVGNHAAIIFWGENTATGTGCVDSGNSYDDNKHGVGTPLNSGAASPGYYGGGLTTCKTHTGPNLCNYMEDGYKYHARIEIVRPATASGGVYNYSMTAWVKRSDAFASAADLTVFKDITSSLIGSVAHTVRRDFTMTAQQHADLKKIFFGYTEGTGGAAQLVKWEALNVFFPLSALRCSYSVAPVSYAAPYGGTTSSQTFTVTPTSASCPWTAVSNDSWITITAGSEGVGGGTVTYNVAANTTGSTRTGTMTIATQTFTVTQAVAPLICTGGTITTAGGKKIHTFTSSGSLVCTGAGSAEIVAIGGGGKGARVTNNPSYGGGGGGGASAISTIVISGGSYPVVVGAGSTTTDAGGDSSFNATSVVAKGGGSVANNSGTGASGGTASSSTGTDTYNGGNGANSAGTSSGGGGGGAGRTGAGGNASGTTGGIGNTPGGDGGDGRSNNGDGLNGSAYGGGGGGGRTNVGTNRDGGEGANGVVIISYPSP